MTAYYSKALLGSPSIKALCVRVFAIKVKIRTIRALAPDLRFGICAYGVVLNALSEVKAEI
ncbi:hypothetical protein PA25_18110 [Pseudoalteromonas sp. A25]|nr:hypothetical protein PA25_18110 [Pseudoalteromonas sp. A25]